MNKSYLSFQDFAMKSASASYAFLPLGFRLKVTMAALIGSPLGMTQREGPLGHLFLDYFQYPALAATWDYDGAVDIRAGAHSDYGSITLLFQRPSQPGLEILTPTSTWSPVPVFPRGTEGDSSPPILVNVGDLLSYWTNGLMRSTVHRVICAKDKLSEDRYSIAYFCHPANDTKLVPIPSKMIQRTQVKSSEVDRDPGTADGITAEEHLRERLAATYGWNDNEE
ncbi:MAG: hypothetical protein LQ342_002970 [Letrouitia transgressa]|nr:MAG: hypothetical protein LQ342_002970 [Letrouitia transgressa]